MPLKINRRCGLFDAASILKSVIWQGLSMEFTVSDNVKTRLTWAVSSHYA